MRRFVFAVLVAPVTIALATSGCGSDELEGVGIDLSGTYDLEQVTISGEVVTPPDANGTATLTATTYSININVFITGVGLVQIMDQGTYSTSGNQWMQESLDTGTQAVGTFSLSGDLLIVNTTLSGVDVEAEWRRTS